MMVPLLLFVLFVQEAFCAFGADFPPKNIVAKGVLVVLSAMKLCVCVCLGAIHCGQNGVL